MLVGGFSTAGESNIRGLRRYGTCAVNIHDGVTFTTARDRRRGCRGGSRWVVATPEIDAKLAKGRAQAIAGASYYSPTNASTRRNNFIIYTWAAPRTSTTRQAACASPAALLDICEPRPWHRFWAVSVPVCL